MKTWKLRSRILRLRLRPARTHRVYSTILDQSIAALATRLRLRFGLPLATDDKNVDRAILSAVLDFLFRKRPEHDDTDTHEKFVDHLKGDRQSLAILQSFLEVQIWVSESLGTGPLSEPAVVASARYSEVFGVEVPSLDPRTVRQRGKNLKAANHQLRKKLVEGRTRKIDVETHLSQASVASWVIFLVPSAITIYGYVYAVTYFRHFGIDTSLFFSIGDYIAFSLNKLGLVISCLVGAAIGSFMAKNRLSDLSEERFNREYRQALILARLVVGTLCIGTLTGFLLSPPMFFVALMGWTIFLDPGERLCRAVMSQYFDPVPTASRWLGLSLTILLLVFLAANSSAHLVTSLDSRSFLIETTEGRFDSSNHKLIGATSEFILLLDDEETVDIVPKRTVKRMNIPNQGISLFLQLQQWVLSHMPEQVRPRQTATPKGR